MNKADIIGAFDLPAGARVDQRVPKKLLLEHAPTAAVRGRIAKGVEEVQWIAALEPKTVGVPLNRDESREYLEIAVLSTALRAGAAAQASGHGRQTRSPTPNWSVAATGRSPRKAISRSFSLATAHPLSSCKVATIRFVATSMISPVER